MAEAYGRESPPVSPADYAERNAPQGDGAASDTRGLIGAAAEAIKERARAAAEEQKEFGADRMNALGRAVHGAADEIGKEMPQFARYIHSAADNLEDASSALRGRSVDEFVDEFMRFVRKQPAVAFAGSVLIGFALSRFFKSSKH